MKKSFKAGALFIMLAALVAISLSTGEGKNKNKKKTSAPIDESKYIGTDTCRICHEKLYDQFERTAHFKSLLHPKWTADQKGCESCHGPGKEHAESGIKEKIFRFVGESPSKIADTCLRCHEAEEEKENFRRSEHGINKVDCLSCHSQHHPAKRGDFLLKMEPTKLCLTCHGEVKTEFALPFHHKVLEGVMKCTDCHNQHGGFNLKLTRASNETDTICVKCHTDKQGPFVFEHPPVKTEGCTSCHLPHGASNARMLRRNEVRFLCLECHANTVGAPGALRGPRTPASHNQALRRWQNCTVCHTQIHGSNLHPRFFE